MSKENANPTFTKVCTPCKGTGELRSSHPDALNVNGNPTGFAYPARTNGMTGEVVAEATRSLCGLCRGTGFRQIREK